MWQDAEGETHSQKIESLHPKVPEACRKDNLLYELLGLADELRVGIVREQNLAIGELIKRILND